MKFFKILLVLGGLVLFVPGCGGETEGTGHKEDSTPAGEATPMPENMEMGEDYEKQNKG